MQGFIVGIPFFPSLEAEALSRLGENDVNKFMFIQR